jgi:hypothetical protein
MGLGVLIALAGSAMAEEPNTPAPSEPSGQSQTVQPVPPSPAPERQVSAEVKETFGRIQAVDLERGVLTIVQDIPLAPDAITELVMNDQTLVTREAQRLDVESLRPGEEYVRIRYVETSGRPVVLAVALEPLPRLKRIAGTTEAIDLINGELAIKPRGLFSGGRQHFRVDESTVITRMGMRSYLTHLLIGDAVTVEYTTDGQTLTARFITAQASPDSQGWFSGWKRGFGGRATLPATQPVTQ